MKACRSDRPDRSDGWALRPNFNAVDHEPNIHGELAQALCTLMDEDGGTFFGRPRAAGGSVRDQGCTGDVGDKVVFARRRRMKL